MLMPLTLTLMLMPVISVVPLMRSMLDSFLSPVPFIGMALPAVVSPATAAGIAPWRASNRR